MKSSINPYVDWLSLPEMERLPTHFELLGVETKENREVEIRAAYYRRVAKISVHQHGPNADHYHDILKELTLARDVLMNSIEREKYRAKLAMTKSEREKPTRQTDENHQTAKSSSTRSTNLSPLPSSTSMRTAKSLSQFSKAAAYASASQAAEQTLSASDVEKLMNAKRANEIDGKNRQNSRSASEPRLKRQNSPFGMFSVVRTPDELLKEVVETRGLTPYQAQCFVDGDGESLVVGPYIIQSEISSSSWGPVFTASRISSGELVSLRKLSPTMATHIPALRRSIQKLANLEGDGFQHPIDCGIQDKQPFIANELILGESLEQLVIRCGPMSPHQAIYCVDQLAKSLSLAEQEGYPHLELRPSKVLLTRMGRVALCDLAVAAIISEGKQKISNLQTLTRLLPQSHLEFCAPEVLVNELRMRFQADIYSLGCILYYCLVGTPPFQRDDPIRTVLAHREESIPKLQDADSNLPAALDHLIAKMLAKKPQDRFASHLELRKSLRDAYHELPKLDQAPSSLFNHVLEQGWAYSAKPPRLRRYHPGRLARVVSIASVLILGLIGGGVYAAKDFGPDAQVIEPSPVTSKAKELREPIIKTIDANSEIPVIESEDHFQVQ